MWEKDNRKNLHGKESRLNSFRCAGIEDAGEVGMRAKKESRGLFPGFRKLKYFQRFEVWETALQSAFLLRKYHGKDVTCTARKIKTDAG